MSIGFYVNLEMPKDCPMCSFAHYDMFNTFCGCDIVRGKRWAVKNDKDYAESSTRSDWCPLIEVPGPHGDLIDREGLQDIIGQFNLNWEYGQGVSDCWDALLNAPTVIPASEEGE